MFTATHEFNGRKVESAVVSQCVESLKRCGIIGGFTVTECAHRIVVAVSYSDKMAEPIFQAAFSEVEAGITMFRLYIDGEFLGIYPGRSAAEVQAEARDSYDAHHQGIIVEAFPVEEK